MPPEIIAALIGAGGAILAAIIAAFLARSIVKDTVNPYFHSYSDKSHDLKKITNKAKHDIFIVVAVGDKLTKKYRSEFERLLSAGIQIRYLLLSEERFRELEQYMHEEPDSIRIYTQTLGILRELKEKYPETIDIHLFDNFLPASYIGIDAWPDSISSPTLPSSIIQIMLYQYRVHAKDSPIVYLSPRSDIKRYNTTVQCIEAMWSNSIDAFPSKTPDTSPRA